MRFALFTSAALAAISLGFAPAIAQQQRTSPGASVGATQSDAPDGSPVSRVRPQTGRAQAGAKELAPGGGGSGAESESPKHSMSATSPESSERANGRQTSESAPPDSNPTRSARDNREENEQDARSKPSSSKDAVAASGAATEKASRQEKSQRENASADDDKAKAATQKSAEEASSGNDRKASATKGREARESSSNSSKSAASSGENTQSRSDASASDEQAAASRDVELSSKEKTEISDRFKRQNVKSVTKVNFSISVGAKVPRRVTLHRVPSAIIDIAPQFRGYDYVVVKDEILIVKPGTRTVVEVIDRDATSATASVSGRASETLKLTRQQRTSVGRTLRTAAEPVINEGATVPQCVELRSMPQTVSVPQLRDYRYFTVGEEIVIVEPESRRVVTIIE